MMGRTEPRTSSSVPPSPLPPSPSSALRRCSVNSHWINLGGSKGIAGAGARVQGQASDLGRTSLGLCFPQALGQCTLRVMSIYCGVRAGVGDQLYHDSAGEAGWYSGLECRPKPECWASIPAFLLHSCVTLGSSSTSLSVTIYKFG